MSALAIALIRGYRRFISPYLAPRCKFQPTCSAYAIQALQKYGFLKGTYLALGRICRCHPFSAGGYDPLK